jgi:filamentous hemagglutinin
MADIRIKDLTTLAPSTASDDFFAADGTTNGTRKLSAYSPSFGGNATVGGTLTVNGKIALATGTTSANGVTFGDLDFYRSFSSILSTTAGTLSGGVGAGFFAINSAGSQPLVLSANNVEGARVTATGNVLIGGTTDISGSGGLKVFGTTASTSTSSGALVVGNGTSGGLGVGGAIFAGGDITSTGSGAQEIVCESTTGANYAGVISKNNSGNTFNLYSLGSTYGGTVFGGVSGNNQAVLEGSASISSICISHANPTGKIIIAPNRTNVLMVENSLVTVASGVDLKLGNAYTAGAPTATGYIVIKDSTGTSYKIPAVAL